MVRGLQLDCFPRLHFWNTLWIFLPLDTLMRNELFEMLTTGMLKEFVQCDRKEMLKVIFLLNAFIIWFVKIGKQLNTRKCIPFILKK